MKAAIKYEVIYSRSKKYPVSILCKFFGVSRSGYYDYVKRRELPQRNTKLAGLIAECQKSCGKTYGNVILIKHDNTYSTLYGHCSELLVRTGKKVNKGSLIALVGSTGDSTGNHCHFEVQVNGEATNPIPYLNKSEKLE